MAAPSTVGPGDGTAVELAGTPANEANAEPLALQLPQLADPPPDWSVLNNVIVQGKVIPFVVVGPNGVFTIEVDPDPTLSVLRHDGLWRHGQRVKEPVKRALRSAFDLRSVLARVGIDVFPYPMLVAAGADGRLGRLQVLPPERLAEAIWDHPGLPLPRSQRQYIATAIMHPATA
jgi:hypothetical protein